MQDTDVSTNAEDIVGALDDIAGALQDVQLAVRDVEHAVERNSGTFWPSLIGLCVGVSLIFLPGLLLHSKWRYALTYDVNVNNVAIQTPPHDCAFLAAPLGEKYCHYDRVVSTVRWGMSTTNQPIHSDDDGKTWSFFTPPAGEQVPQHHTVKRVLVAWQKVEE